MNDKNDYPSPMGPEDELWRIDGSALRRYIVSLIGGDKILVAKARSSARVILVTYHVELTTWKANLRLASMSPHDGTRWMAYLSWDRRGQRKLDVFEVVGKPRYW